MEIIVSSLLLLGLIALIATTIKYPKDVGGLLRAILLMPFEYLWDLIRLILLPISFVVLIIEEKSGVNFFSKFIYKRGSKAYKTIGRKAISFSKFKKYIIINSTSAKILEQIKEAEETCIEMNIDQLRILKRENYSIVEMPKVGFYGYNFMSVVSRKP